MKHRNSVTARDLLSFSLSKLLETPLSFVQNNSFLSNIIDLFCHYISIQVLHEYTGFVPSVLRVCNAKSFLVSETILTLPRLNAFIFTVLSCYSDHVLDKVGGYCQKLYHDTFTSFLPTTFSHMIAVLIIFVDEKRPVKTAIFRTSIYGFETCVSPVTL